MQSAGTDALLFIEHFLFGTPERTVDRLIFEVEMLDSTDPLLGTVVDDFNVNNKLLDIASVAITLLEICLIVVDSRVLGVDCFIVSVFVGAADVSEGPSDK